MIFPIVSLGYQMPDSTEPSGIPGALVITKNSALPAINLGLAIAIILAVWFGAQRVRDLENQVADTSGRQAKYVGMNGYYSRELLRVNEIVHVLELRVLVLETISDGSNP